MHPLRHQLLFPRNEVCTVTDKNIAAYTPSGTSYPAYVSINERDGQVEITVRSPADADGNCGSTSAMKLSPHEFAGLIRSCGAYLVENEQLP